MRQNLIKTKSLGPRKNFVEYHELSLKFCTYFAQFCPFSCHEQKLMKFIKYLTFFPSHFNNIYLKSFFLLQNLMKKYDILWKLTKCYETNEKSTQPLLELKIWPICPVCWNLSMAKCFRQQHQRHWLYLPWLLGHYNRLNAWTNFSLKYETIAVIPTPQDVTCIPCTYHSVPKKTAKLRVENSALTTFKFSSMSYRAPLTIISLRGCPGSQV